jgi:hypothetical protein
MAQQLQPARRQQQLLQVALDRHAHRMAGSRPHSSSASALSTYTACGPTSTHATQPKYNCNAAEWIDELSTAFHHYRKMLNVCIAKDK